jgi:hypothetical protein
MSTATLERVEVGEARFVRVLQREVEEAEAEHRREAAEAKAASARSEAAAKAAQRAALAAATAPRNEFNVD